MRALGAVARRALGAVALGAVMPRAVAVGTVALGALAPRTVAPGAVMRAMLCALAVLSVVVVACEPTLQQQTGIVVRVDSPSLGRVDSFELLTSDGDVLVFDTSSLEFRQEFPPSHLAEHQVIGDEIVVTYKRDGDRLVVTQLDDRAH